MCRKLGHQNEKGTQQADMATRERVDRERLKERLFGSQRRGEAKGRQTVMWVTTERCPSHAGG